MKIKDMIKSITKSNSIKYKNGTTFLLIKYTNESKIKYFQAIADRGEGLFYKNGVLEYGCDNGQNGYYSTDIPEHIIKELKKKLPIKLYNEIKFSWEQ